VLSVNPCVKNVKKNILFKKAAQKNKNDIFLAPKTGRKYV
jgi:hypothetical protein